MKVQVKVEYEYWPNYNEPCQAKLTLYLPTYEKSKGSRPLHYLLQSARTFLLSGKEHLTEWWGEATYDMTKRYETITVGADTWEELNDKVRRLIDEAVATIRGVYQHNKMMLATKPENYVEEFDLGE